MSHYIWNMKLLCCQVGLPFHCTAAPRALSRCTLRCLWPSVCAPERKTTQVVQFFWTPNCKIISALCWVGTCLGSHCDLLWNVKSYIKIYKEINADSRPVQKPADFGPPWPPFKLWNRNQKGMKGLKCTYYIQKMHVSCVFKKLCRVCTYEYIKIYLYIRCHWCHLYHCLKKKRRGRRTNSQINIHRVPAPTSCAPALMWGQDMAGLLKANDMPLFQ